PPPGLGLVAAAEQLLPDPRPVLTAAGHQLVHVHPVDSGGPAVSHHALVCCQNVFPAQHLLHEPRSLVTSILSVCRVRLTLKARILGGSAAYFPGSLGHLSLLGCVFFGHRTPRAGSAPHVRPFAAVRRRPLPPRPTPAHRRRSSRRRQP